MSIPVAPRQISAWYKWISLITLAFSIGGPLVLVEGPTSDTIWIGILMNLQFHLAYQFLSNAPLLMYQSMDQQNFKFRLVLEKMLKAFSWAAMAIAPVGLAGVIADAIHDQPKFLATAVFPGVFLGGYASVAKFRAIDVVERKP